MGKYVRARRGAGILLHPDTGGLVTPNPDVPIDADDPLVKRYPWAFVSDAELAGEVEEATARPGEKRVVSSSVKKSAKP
jgi:hypothetical protein